MINELKKNKYGTHRRISDKNIERIKKLGNMGDSVNKVVGVLLDNIEDVDNCLNGNEPQTEKLKLLRKKWNTLEK